MQINLQPGATAEPVASNWPQSQTEIPLAGLVRKRRKPKAPCNAARSVVNVYSTHLVFSLLPPDAYLGRFLTGSLPLNAEGLPTATNKWASKEVTTQYEMAFGLLFSMHMKRNWKTVVLHETRCL